MMKINVAVNVGNEKNDCRGCDYFTNGGMYCQLFRKRLPQEIVQSADPKIVIRSCDECLKAKAQPELFSTKKKGLTHPVNLVQ